MPTNRLLASDSTSRLLTRYDAKKTISASLPNSPGWICPTPGSASQIFAPLLFGSLIRDGSTAGRITNSRPPMPSVYEYRESTRWSRMNSRTTQNAVIPTSVQMTCRRPWPPYVSGSVPLPVAETSPSRWMKITPMPFSSATHGRMIGSAYEAKNRTTTCAIRKTAVSAAGM